MSYIGEADEILYKQQAAEDKHREFLERRSRMGGPESPEPCEDCGGEGYGKSADDGFCGPECSRCLGTGVEP